MSNKKLTFEQAVLSGKDFRCDETGIIFKSQFLHTYRFEPDWLDQTFEIIEVKKEFTASDFNEIIASCESLMGGHVDVSELKSKLGF